MRAMNDSQRGLFEWIQFITVIVGIAASSIVFMSVMVGIPDWRKDTDIWRNRIDREGSWALQEHSKAQAIRFQIHEERIQRLEAIVSELKDGRAMIQTMLNDTKATALDNSRKLDVILKSRSIP